ALAALVVAGPASAMRWLDGGPGHVIQVPADITTEATAGGGATVNYTVSVNPNEPATCSPTSGSLFGIGTTQVTCTADDADPASFNVTVQDTTAPTVSVPASAGGTTTDHSGMTVTWPNPTANDTVDGALTPTCTPASGDRKSVV